MRLDEIEFFVIQAPGFRKNFRRNANFSEIMDDRRDVQPLKHIFSAA